MPKFLNLVSSSLPSTGSPFLVGGQFSQFETGSTPSLRGLTFTRGSVATTYDETAGTVVTGIAINTARIAKDASARVGLLIEPSRTNLVLHDSLLTVGANGWVAGTGAIETADAVVAPDGTTTAERSAGASATYATYWSKAAVHAVGTVYAVSLWARNNGSGQPSILSEVSAASAAPLSPLGATWQRARTSATDTAGLTGNNHRFVDGRDQSGVGGNTATAYDLYRWGHQVEVTGAGASARWASSLIQTTGTAATRSADALASPSASAVVAETLHFYAKLVAPAARASMGEGAGTTVTLFKAGSYFATMNITTGIITIGARNVADSAFVTDTTSTALPSFAAGDIVEVLVTVGGSAPCLVRYRINGGFVITMGTATGTSMRVPTTGASPIGASIDLLHDAGTNVLGGIVQAVGFTKPLSDPLSASMLTVGSLGGLVAWHELTDSSDYVIGTGISTWKDRAAQSGSQTQGTGANQPTYVANVAGFNNTAGATFDGNDRMSAANTVDLSGGYTLISVIRSGTLADWRGILRVAQNESTGTDGICYYYNLNGEIVVTGADAASWYRISPAGTITANTSYVVSLRCSGTSGSLSLRVNGAVVALGVLTGVFAMPFAASRVYVGRGWNSSLVNGTIGGHVVLRRALSDTDVLTAEQQLGTPRGIIF